MRGFGGKQECDRAIERACAWVWGLMKIRQEMMQPGA
jgi:hypothetical protein